MTHRTTTRVGQAVFALACVALVGVLVAIPLVDDAELHVPADTLATYNSLSIALWVGSLFASVGLIVLRAIRYVVDRVPIPVLLWRDLIWVLGLTVPVSLLFLARLYVQAQTPPSPTALSTWLPWVMWTTLPALIGMGTFLFDELFVIDR